MQRCQIQDSLRSRSPQYAFMTDAASSSLHAPGLRIRARGVVRACVLLALATSAWAQSAADLLAEIDAGLDEIELSLHGSTKRAEAIAELVDEDLGLPAADVVLLRQALAEAWLTAGVIDRAQTVAADLVADAALEPAAREAAALLWIAAWQQGVSAAEAPDTLPAPLPGAWPDGEPPLAVRVRALTAEAARDLSQDRQAQALARYDEALVLLKDREPDERVPIYVLRLMAMERPEPDPEAIKAWLHQHASDPALAQVASSALTAGQQLIGQTAPPWTAKRIDGVDGAIDLAKLRGSVVLLDYFATWCQPCEAVAPVVAALAKRYEARGLVTIGVSLDTRETVHQLPDFLRRHGMAYPVVGELLGWDGELEKAFHIDGIPSLVLIGADGRIAAVDLLGSTPEATAKRLTEALDSALRAAAPAPAGGVLPGVLP